MTMTSEETTILTNMLTLTNKVLSNDPAVDDAVNAINAVTFSIADYNDLIEEDARGIIERTTLNTTAITTKIINNLTALADSKDILLGVLNARTLDITDTVAVKAFIDSALTGSINDFGYFSLVAKLAISISDKTRIASVITKIESLGA